MRLFEWFGGKVEKAIILQIWKDSNQFYTEALTKLKQICSFDSINEFKQDNKVKIMKELCLHIFWNLLKYPKDLKYRQISSKYLYNNLQSKCHQVGENMDKIVGHMEQLLQRFGFEKYNDDNWYYSNGNINLLWLWTCYQLFSEEQIMYYLWFVHFVVIHDLQIMYKIRFTIPRMVCILLNGKWKDYESVFDYQHRTIMLFDKNKLKIKSLQVGNPKRSSLEFNVHIQWYNHSDISQTHTKWACLILNRTWHFRMANCFDRDDLSYCCSEFNSFHVFWKIKATETLREPMNPYSTTLKQGIQHIKDKFQMRSHFLFGGDKLITSKCDFEQWKPRIETNKNNGDILLHDIYKYFFGYPSIQVYWEIECRYIVPYERTIATERTNLPENDELSVEFISSNEKPTFNPLLYECDFHKVKTIEDTLHSKLIRNNYLQKLLHEIIKNNYLRDLITHQHTKNKQEKKQIYERIKQQINYKEEDKNGKLILNDKILTILNELKILYHDDIHKHMGYPLQLHHICAILLYCGKSCNAEFSYDQIKFRHQKWPYLDSCLLDAIGILGSYERVEESEIELYCGLKRVRLDNVEKEINAGYFISYVSTSDDIEVAKMFRGSHGCILHFHPSMRRANGIFSCDVSWISPFKHEREILFSRSRIMFDTSEKLHKERLIWNAKVEDEDEHTQMILLTSAMYDRYIQQTMQLSAMWNHSIDLNLIYLLLSKLQISMERLNGLNKVLLAFDAWKKQNNNEQRYEEIKSEFVNNRCCNDAINLFSIFLFEKNVLHTTVIEYATAATLSQGSPFVERDKYKNRVKDLIWSKQTFFC
ncbi:hypothetical protein RFI_09804 [Reticulomyxa filosa]|uniref:Uncharacterized protein n=1 Tax=Reticulomyxa filosa TaxID=46433 RepID=X6NN14_RETFI|nr:hypothetical protein RFI_09804 [Reticulomyxa filosa]|eukprot:ETO27328.1 hypothetical protein RFI_09804 [Reticulomyxa filosa]